MLAFFDFLPRLAAYEDRGRSVDRMNRRHRFLIDAYADQIAGARVLDLGAHDGRWAYAMAGAGAETVVAIEARVAAAQGFADFPDTSLRAKVEMRIDDVFLGLEQAITAGETYDVVAVFGLLYHVMDHFRLLTLIKALDPSLVIIDSEFTKRSAPVITLVHERTDNALNAVPQFAGQQRAIKGIPSKSALEVMAMALGYTIEWADWANLPPDDRSGVRDYYLQDDRQYLRATCALRP